MNGRLFQVVFKIISKVKSCPESTIIIHFLFNYYEKIYFIVITNFYYFTHFFIKNLLLLIWFLSLTALTIKQHFFILYERKLTIFNILIYPSYVRTTWTAENGNLFFYKKFQLLFEQQKICSELTRKFKF